MSKKLLTTLTFEDLHEMIGGTASFVLVDVRARLEYAETHIEGAINIPVAELRNRHQELELQIFHEL